MVTLIFNIPTISYYYLFRVIEHQKGMTVHYYSLLFSALLFQDYSSDYLQCWHFAHVVSRSVTRGIRLFCDLLARLWRTSRKVFSADRPAYGRTKEEQRKSYLSCAKNRLEVFFQALIIALKPEQIGGEILDRKNFVIQIIYYYSNYILLQIIYYFIWDSSKISPIQTKNTR